MYTLAIANRKGGNGKTTSVHAIGAALQKRGFKVLLVDLDAQANLSLTVGADITGMHGYSLQVILNEKPITESIQHLENGIDILAAHSRNATADKELSETIGKEYRLKEALASVGGYDFCLIDCPPQLGTLTINALTAADYVIIPCQTDLFSIQAFAQMFKTISTIKQYCNHDLNILGALIVRHNPRPLVNREAQRMLEETLQYNSVPLLQTTIRECSAVREAQLMRKNIFDYAPRSNAAKDYASLTDEILEVLKNG